MLKVKGGNDYWWMTGVFRTFCEIKKLRQRKVSGRIKNLAQGVNSLKPGKIGGARDHISLYESGHRA
jgi:hypothetical protein